MKEEYKSVSCGFYDELEAFAISLKKCEIAFWNENGAKTITKDSIKNLFAHEGIEWLETGKGLKIRLDKLINVDGKMLYNQC